MRGGVQNDVRFLGFVPIEVLRIFYDAAKVFVFPSLYEGFGLPPLEAMAHGTPVLTSNTSSIPEVVGNAAVMVNPENVFEMMRALHRVLLDQALREKMKQRSYEQAEKFSWEKSVRRILKAYHGVVSPPAKRSPAQSTSTSTSRPQAWLDRWIPAAGADLKCQRSYLSRGWPGEATASLCSLAVTRLRSASVWAEPRRLRRMVTLC